MMRDHMEKRFGINNIYEMNPPPPQCLNLELNNTCNQRCIFCPFHSPYSKHREKPFHMPLNLAKEILNKAKDEGVGERELGLYATGEPLVYPHLEECISYSKKLGFSYVFLTSNGVLATPERMRRLINAGLDSIRFSVNAVEKNVYKKIHGTDSLSDVVDNIRFLAEYKKKESLKIQISISSVITNKTESNLVKIKELFSTMVDEIVFFPVLDLKDLNEDLEKEYGIGPRSFVSSKRRICPILFNSMYINCHGQVRICCDARATKIIAGELGKDMDILKIWNSKIMKDYRRMHLEGNVDGSVCDGCYLSERDIKEYLL